MSDEIITINGREYALCHSFAKIEAKELARRYRDTEKFIAYCKECNRYNACHACPPFDFNTDEYLMPYRTACIPEYFTLVSGFFNTKDIADFFLINAIKLNINNKSLKTRK